jgi:hypothetical protein
MAHDDIVISSMDEFEAVYASAMLGLTRRPDESDKALRERVMVELDRLQAQATRSADAIGDWIHSQPVFARGGRVFIDGEDVGAISDIRLVRPELRTIDVSFTVDDPLDTPNKGATMQNPYDRRGENRRGRTTGDVRRDAARMGLATDSEIPPRTDPRPLDLLDYAPDRPGGAPTPIGPGLRLADLEPLLLQHYERGRRDERANNSEAHDAAIRDEARRAWDDGAAAGMDEGERRLLARISEQFDAPVNEAVRDIEKTLERPKATRDELRADLDRARALLAKLVARHHEGFPQEIPF